MRLLTIFPGAFSQGNRRTMNNWPMGKGQRLKKAGADGINVKWWKELRIVNKKEWKIKKKNANVHRGQPPAAFGSFSQKGQISVEDGPMGMRKEKSVHGQLL
jgi:hypothetical protein